MSECSHDCSACSQSCGERSQPESLIKAPHEMSKIKKVIAVVSGKGGVGKSMITALLAVEMQRRGFSTAVLDADVTGPSIPRAFGLRGLAAGDASGIFPMRTKTGIEVISMNLLLENAEDPVLWRGPIIGGVVDQFWTDVVWGDVDYMFIDMPPGTGDVPLTVFQTIPVDGIVVVASPQELVGMIVEKAVRMADLMKIPVLALVENMAYFECPNCGERHYIYGESHADEIAKKHGIELVAKMPIAPKLAAACDAGLMELSEVDHLNALCDSFEKM